MSDDSLGALMISLAPRPSDVSNISCGYDVDLSPDPTLCEGKGSGDLGRLLGLASSGHACRHSSA